MSGGASPLEPIASPRNVVLSVNVGSNVDVEMPGMRKSSIILKSPAHRKTQDDMALLHREGSATSSVRMLKSRLKDDLLLSQHKLLSLEVRNSGESEFRELRRSDILHECRDIVHRVFPNPLEAAEVRGVIQPRDLRLVDPTFYGSRQLSAIIVRKNGLIVSVGSINVIILHNHCYFFVPDGADSILSSFMSKLREPLASDDTPFEFRAMEAVLTTLSLDYRSSYNDCKKQCDTTFKQLKLDLSAQNLENLRKVKNTAKQLISRVGDASKVMGELLENEEELALMYLSTWIDDPNCYDDILHPAWRTKNDEAELLIEAYLLEIDTILEDTKMVMEEIESIEDLIEMQLAAARNQLLKVDTLFSIASVCITFGALVTGIFGMNLKSNLEDDFRWFYGVIIGIIGVSFIFFFTIVMYLRRIGLFGGMNKRKTM